MNIWLINHYAVEPKWHPLLRTTNFAKYLMRLGHNVTIFASSTVHNNPKNLITDESQYKETYVNNIHYVYVKTDVYKGNGLKRVINMFQFAHRLPKVCMNFKRPDVIMASSATPLACSAGLNLARKYRCKGIAEISDLWPESFVAYGLISTRNPLLRLMYLYEKRMYRKADKIIFTMEGGREYIINKGWDTAHNGPINLSNVYHINNGVDLETYLYNEKKYKYNDKELEDNDRFKVVYTGSIRRVNQISILVDAAKYIKTFGYETIDFFVFGDGDQKEALEQRCIDEGINNVTFKGYVDKKYIPSILSQSDLNIVVGQSISLYKYGLSLNKFFDYMASGKPIISTLACNYDIIKENKCGVTLQEEGDAVAKSLAKRIIFYHDMGFEEYEKECLNAKKAALLYDFKELTRKLEQILLSTN